MLIQKRMFQILSAALLASLFQPLQAAHPNHNSQSHGYEEDPCLECWNPLETPLVRIGETLYIRSQENLVEIWLDPASNPDLVHQHLPIQLLADNNEEEDLDDAEGLTIQIFLPQRLADNNEEEDLDDAEGLTLQILTPQRLADNNEEEDLDDAEGVPATIILRIGGR